MRGINDATPFKTLKLRIHSADGFERMDSLERLGSEGHAILLWELNEHVISGSAERRSIEVLIDAM